MTPKRPKCPTCGDTGSIWLVNSRTIDAREARRAWAPCIRCEFPERVDGFPFGRFGVGDLPNPAISHRMPGGFELVAVAGTIDPDDQRTGLGWTVRNFEARENTP